MIVIKAIFMILMLVLLYQLMMWAAPILAGVGLGWLALQHGSGWLVAIGTGFLGAVLALGIIHFGMACRSLVIRIPVALLFIVPPIWGGAIATRSMAMQTGAEGSVWPVVAAIGGGLIFGLLALLRLLGMTSTPAPAPRVEPFPAPEPKVAYYHPIEPARPRLSDRRGDDDRIIDL